MASIRNIAAGRKAQVEALKDALNSEIASRREAEKEMRAVKKEKERLEEVVASLVAEKKQLMQESVA